MTRREFMGEEFYKSCSQDNQRLREFRNSVSNRRPTAAELAQLAINKPWEQFYGRILK